MGSGTIRRRQARHQRPIYVHLAEGLPAPPPIPPAERPQPPRPPRPPRPEPSGGDGVLIALAQLGWLALYGLGGLLLAIGLMLLARWWWGLMTGGG